LLPQQQQQHSLFSLAASNAEITDLAP